MLEYNNQITGKDLLQLNKNVDQFNKQLGNIKNKPNEGMGKDDFLKLFTVQLSHQNPLEPMDNTAFISQMAQFSALEQMQNVGHEVKKMREDFSQMWGVNLIGKKASFLNDLGEIENGEINKVNFKNGQSLEINGKKVELENISSIENKQINSQQGFKQ